MSDSPRAEGVRGPGFVIDGKAVAAAVRARVATEVRSFEAETGRTPGLATLPPKQKLQIGFPFAKIARFKETSIALSYTNSF